jgi:hypothetical protein
MNAHIKTASLYYWIVACLYLVSQHYMFLDISAFAKWNRKLKVAGSLAKGKRPPLLTVYVHVDGILEPGRIYVP